MVTPCRLPTNRRRDGGKMGSITLYSFFIRGPLIVGATTEMMATAEKIFPTSSFDTSLVERALITANWQ